jgi:hypothetical protein
MEAQARAGWLAAVLSALAGAATAHAQVRTSDPMTTHALSIDGELHAGEARDVGHGGASCSPTPTGIVCTDPVAIGRPFGTLALDVAGRVARVGQEDEALFVELDASLRLGLREAYREDGSWRGAWMGVWLGAALAHRTPSLTLRGSVGLAPPLRTAIQSGLREDQLAAGWGQWDHWLAVEQVVPFGFLGLVEGRLAALDVGADTALVLGPSFPVPTLAGPADRGVFFWAGLGGWLSAHLGEAVRLGLRVQGVLWLHAGPEDRCDASGCASRDDLYSDFQASAIPFVRVLFPPGHLELRLQLNLDEPHGPTLAGREQVWAVAVRGGASWDP